MCPSLSPRPAVELPGQVVVKTRAMATDITTRAVLTGDLAAIQAALADVVSVFADVEQQCSRFIPDSPLMRANSTPASWHRVPGWCFAALQEAARAHRETAGRFDPRVLTDLIRLGYDRSLPFATGAVTLPAPRQSPAGRRPPWQPQFRARGEVLLGEPVDLGGIGKGLAVRWARDRLAEATGNFLIEAGGDCYCAGRSAEGLPWQVGVEDPDRPTELVAVLGLEDSACATSSIRLRKWQSGDRPVHHLIDPTTGEPGGAGLTAVTVVADDPAWAEVFSKTLFLSGADRIAGDAAASGVAALWIAADGTVGTSAPLEELLTWRR